MTGMFRILVVTAIATLSGAVGQILMRRGMQIVGPLESYAVLDILQYLWHAITQPYVIGGTILSGIFFFALLTALGWTDVTVAFPLTALEYAFAALLAVIVLKERVPALRWVGIALVIAGVILISASGGENSKPQKNESTYKEQPNLESTG
jgi:drug/metabolite transporter (DMT)-like permease